MAPAALGAGVVQVNQFIGILLASLLPAGAISYLYYADRVVQLPLGVVGVAIGTAVLPLLSRQVQGDWDVEARDTQNRALEMALLLTMPAATALALIAEPVTTVLFERGRFTPEASAATAAAMAAFAFGLPAFVLIKVFQPGFFARQDTATPVKVAVTAVIANLAFNLVLMPLFAHVGIALSTTLAAWLNAGILAWLLRKRGYFTPDERLVRRVPRIVLAAVSMALAVWVTSLALEPWLQADSIAGVTGLVGLVVLGLVVYAAACVGLGAARPSELRAALQRVDTRETP